MYTKVNVRSISMIAVLVAIQVVLARFSIHTWNLKIGFGFVPVVVAAIFYGPVSAGLVGAIGDVVSAVLFPVGAFFPGFTLCAFLTGAVFGLFLKKKQNLVRISVSVLLNQIVFSQIVNTFFISFLYGSPYVPLFMTRIYQTVAMSVVEIAVIFILVKKLVPVLRRHEELL